MTILTVDGKERITRISFLLLAAATLLVDRLSAIRGECEHVSGSLHGLGLAESLWFEADLKFVSVSWNSPVLTQDC
eukprot:6485721-Amphidinium_carterae.1